MPNPRPAVNHDMAFQHAVIPDLHSFFQHHVRADGRIPAQLDVRGDDCGGMNAPGRTIRRMEKLERLGKGEVGICRTQRGAPREVPVGAGNDGRRACGLDFAQVFGIGKKSQIVGCSLVHSSNAADFQVFRTFELAFKPRRHFTQFHGCLLLNVRVPGEPPPGLCRQSTPKSAG